MASTSFTSDFRFSLPDHHRCFCGNISVVRTTWKASNPGRRFYCCRDTTCGFFRWADPEMCERSKVIIPGLLKKINKLEAELEMAVKKLKNVVRVIIVVLSVLVLVLAVALTVTMLKM